MITLYIVGYFLLGFACACGYVKWVASDRSESPYSDIGSVVKCIVVWPIIITLFVLESMAKLAFKVAGKR
jgi:hypothetical protein